MTEDQKKTALIVGASRGLGVAMAAEFLRRGWHIIGTVRGDGTALHDLADDSGRLEIDVLDMTIPDQVAALRDRLSGRSLDLLFVNGAIARENVPIAEVPTNTFIEVMVTNVLSPMRVVETFKDLVPDSGTIGIMSSRQGSVSLNTNGGHEVYRASKSALNQLVRSFAARHAGDPRTLLLISPGHVKTELGGDDAKLTVDDSIPGVVDTIVARQGDGGLHFLDYRGEVIPW